MSKPPAGLPLMKQVPRRLIQSRVDESQTRSAA